MNPLHDIAAISCRTKFDCVILCKILVTTQYYVYHGNSGSYQPTRGCQTLNQTYDDESLVSVR